MNYYANPALSQSKLKELKKSPRHFYTKYIMMSSQLSTTPAMEFGKAVHMCLFEHSLFMKNYVEEPEVDKRTSLGKATILRFNEDHPNKILLSKNDWTAIHRIRNAVLNKRTSRHLINKGLPEHELYWTDEPTNISCKAKLDYFIEPCTNFPNGIIIDLKTTTNANCEEFAKAIYKFGYYHQVAFYAEAVKIIYKTEHYPTFIFIAAEKEEPYECSFFGAVTEMLELGLAENRKLINLYRDCYVANQWHGYLDQVEEINLPMWAINKIKGN